MSLCWLRGSVIGAIFARLCDAYVGDAWHGIMTPVIFTLS